MSKQIRVLPADVYDFLELSALAFGGIGSGAFAENGEGRTDVAAGHVAPHCVWGHAAAAGSLPGEWGDYNYNDVTLALETAGIDYTANDDAVDAALKRRGVDEYAVGDRAARITFKAWAKRLGVVRGDA